MATEIKVLKGEVFTDHRGEIFSLNEFDFKDVKRTYVIRHPDSSVIRGWHGHQRERKWFYCIKGEWILALVRIDDWHNPSPDLKPEIYRLSDKVSRLICVPAGYANCLKADSDDAILQVFSDVPISKASEDSWRYDSSLWMEWK